MYNSILKSYEIQNVAFSKRCSLSQLRLFVCQLKLQSILLKLTQVTQLHVLISCGMQQWLQIRLVALQNTLAHHTWGPCYKTLFVRNLRIFVISQSVGPQQAFPVQSNVSGKRPGTYPQSGAPERLFNAAGSCFTNKHKSRLERLVRNKHSSFLRIFVNYGRKEFYNIGPCIYWLMLQHTDREC